MLPWNSYLKAEAFLPLCMRADRILGDSVAYRDSRTDGMDTLLEEILPFSRHYALTGIAKQPFNTVYQLMAPFRSHPQHRQQAKTFLMVQMIAAGEVADLASARTIIKNSFTITEVSPC